MKRITNSIRRDALHEKPYLERYIVSQMLSFKLYKETFNALQSIRKDALHHKLYQESWVHHNLYRERCSISQNLSGTMQYITNYIRKDVMYHKLYQERQNALQMVSGKMQCITNWMSIDGLHHKLYRGKMQCITNCIIATINTTNTPVQYEIPSARF